MGRRGPPRTPTAELKSKGTYREREHGGRADCLYKTGTPKKPVGLDAEGERMWNHVIAHVPDVILCFADAMALEMLCRTWSIWHLNIGSGDYKDQVLAMSASKTVQGLLAKFGLTPPDRANLKIPQNAKQDKADRFASFLQAKVN